MYGRTGYLFTLLWLNATLGAGTADGDGKIARRVLDQLFTNGHRGARTIDKASPLFYYWHDAGYLGGAHGLAGILLMMLEHAHLLSAKELEQVEQALLFLLAQKFPSGTFWVASLPFRSPCVSF